MQNTETAIYYGPPDSNTLYMLGSSASDSASNQSDTEDDNNVLYQLNDSMDGSNGMEQDET